MITFKLKILVLLGGLIGTTAFNHFSIEIARREIAGTIEQMRYDNGKITKTGLIEPQRTGTKQANHEKLAAHLELREHLSVALIIICCLLFIALTERIESGVLNPATKYNLPE